MEHRQEHAGNTLPTWLENQNPKLFPMAPPSPMSPLPCTLYCLIGFEHFGNLSGISGLLELGGRGTTAVMVGTAAKSEGGYQRPAGLLDE